MFFEDLDSLSGCVEGLLGEKISTASRVCMERDDLDSLHGFLNLFYGCVEEANTCGAVCYRAEVVDSIIVLVW